MKVLGVAEVLPQDRRPVGVNHRLTELPFALQDLVDDCAKKHEDAKDNRGNAQMLVS
jgi:hypothetical protein